MGLRLGLGGRLLGEIFSTSSKAKSTFCACPAFQGVPTATSQRLQRPRTPFFSLLPWKD